MIHRDKTGKFIAGKRRKCLYCRVLLTNKRPDAIYCCDKHRAIARKIIQEYKTIVSDIKKEQEIN